MAINSTIQLTHLTNIPALFPHIGTNSIFNTIDTLPDAFEAKYDETGNQTLIKTSTGIWSVAYDANNRPISFISENGQTIITCGYDFLGRRFEKKSFSMVQLYFIIVTFTGVTCKLLH